MPSLSVIPVPSVISLLSVIPAEAGIQSCHDVWVPASARTTKRRHSHALRHSRAGGNPSFHHCMGPRIREDDKKGSSESSFPPEHFFLMRGVLSAKERHPRMFLSGTGIHLCIIAWVPASARTTEPTSQLQKGRQDVSEPVGTLCVYYMVEEVLDHAAKEIT